MNAITDRTALVSTTTYNQIWSANKASSGNDIDTDIQTFIDAGNEFKFTYQGQQYTIKKEFNNYVCSNVVNGNVIDPDVQINSDGTIDGFLEIRGLPASAGEALYVGNIPKNNGEIRFIFGSHLLDADAQSTHAENAATLLNGPAEKKIGAQKIEAGVNDAQNQVRHDDVDYVTPGGDGAVVSPIFGYTWTNNLIDNYFGKNQNDYEWPMYNRADMDKTKPEYWDTFVDELLLARVSVISFHHRGEKLGQMNVEDLDGFFAATERAGVTDQFKIAYFEDTGMKEGENKELAGFGEGKVDCSKESDQRYIYEAYYKKFFETIPRDMWYTVNDRPVISSWNLLSSDYANRQDASEMLDYCAERFEDEFGVTPYWILQENWIEQDPRLESKEYVLGTHDWFSKAKGENYTYSTHEDFTTGVITPGYANRDDDGKFIISRDQNGRNVAEEGFLKGRDRDADFILLEGWTGMVENIGWYRSLKWDQPNQYINTVRNYSDPDPKSIRFQVEGADVVNDFTEGNSIGDHSGRDVDVRRYQSGAAGSVEHASSGWVVDDIQSGESVTYTNVALGGGSYRFTGRVKGMGDDDKLTFRVIDSTSRQPVGVFSVDIEANGTFELHHLGQFDLEKGKYDLQMEFRSDGMQVDWFHMKKVIAPPQQTIKPYLMGELPQIKSNHRGVKR